MKNGAPNGYFAGGLMLFGSLEKGGGASKGYILQPPDLRGASVAHLNAYQAKIQTLLASLGEGLRAQVQWTCNCDYRQELTRYFREAEQKGYENAMNQAVKQQYWIIQNQQRAQEARNESSARLVPVELPETIVNGVILKPSVEYLRVEP